MGLREYGWALLDVRAGAAPDSRGDDAAEGIKVVKGRCSM